MLMVFTVAALIEDVSRRTRLSLLLLLLLLLQMWREVLGLLLLVDHGLVAVQILLDVAQISLLLLQLLQ